MDNQATEDKPHKRKGPAPTGHSPILFARVPPATLAAVKSEAARRGTVPSALVREALDLLLKEAGERLAAA
jgi:hypothetical protein